jgi:hypothetical protein
MSRPDRKREMDFAMPFSRFGPETWAAAAVGATTRDLTQVSDQHSGQHALMQRITRRFGDHSNAHANIIR